MLTILLKAFVVQVFSIPSGSMENTLLPGDRILVNKVVYRFRPIERGDIVVFSGSGSWDPVTPAPSNPVVRFLDDAKDLVGIAGPGTDYVKRVIGVPGDHVVCCNSLGQVTVNGVALSEKSYIYPGAVPSQIRFNIIVPTGRLWVMGDNRADSDDSRYRTERARQRDHPGERGRGPGIPDHLAALPPHRSAHPQYLPAGGAAHGGRGRHRATGRRGRWRRCSGRRHARVAPPSAPLRSSVSQIVNGIVNNLASLARPMPGLCQEQHGGLGCVWRKWRYARSGERRGRGRA